MPQLGKLFRICLIQPFDPRGSKVGGLETYIRDYVTFYPNDVDLVMIGVDSIGDLEIGAITSITFRDRTFGFLPIMRISDEEVREAASSLFGSLTFRFFTHMLRHAVAVRNVLRGRSVELRRVEYAIFPTLLGRPFIQMIHGEGAPRKPMDSILKRYRLVQTFNEWLAITFSQRMYCVNPFITERMQQTYPRSSRKVETLTTWANTRIFAPQPFPADASTFKVVFTGRLDTFKNPSLLFNTIKAVAQRVDKVEFHYVGTSDPHRFAEFAAIAPLTRLHGFLPADGIARLYRDMHVGILTSEFEGMPRAVLEVLASGRPVVAMHLPQLEPVIEEAVSGFLVARSGDARTRVEQLSERLVLTHDMIKRKAFDPERVAACMAAFSPDVLLGRVYQAHRDIHEQLSHLV